MSDSRPPEIVLVSHTEGDAGALARLWCITFEDKWRHIFGNAAEAFLETWLARDSHVLEGTTVARQGGLIVGFMQVAIPTPSRSHNTRALWSSLYGHFGLVGALSRLLKLWVIEHAPAPAPGDLRLKMLAVDPKWRGRGVATRLLGFAEDEARRIGKDRLVLEVIRDNAGAIRLYERQGFKREGIRRSLALRWAIGHSAYCGMAKNLESPNRKT